MVQISKVNILLIYVFVLNILGKYTSSKKFGVEYLH